MTRRALFASLVCLMVLAEACSLQEPASLDDPELLDRIGVETPTDIVWTRTIDGIEVAGTTRAADPAELSVLTRALAEVPDALVSAADVRTIYRITDAAEEDLEPTTLAFARGPDLYVLDATFAGIYGEGVGPMEMARVLSHELAHVAQFRRLTADDAGLILESPTDVDPLQLAESTRDFAAATGWRDGGSDPRSPSWVLPSPGGTTAYGATEPEEDLAEAVSMVSMGWATQLSADRVAWVEDWLDLDADRVATGKPYIPAGAIPTSSETDLYDTRTVSGFAARNPEPLYWVALGADFDSTRAEIGAALAERGVAGAFEPIEIGTVPREGGRFGRPDGVSYWVEVWDFSGSAISGAPDGLVITYVVLW
ncbi:MAG: hypothetical protein HKN01_12275 [Acidimicrobiia bacterium]|nr:hypothetical protein [Acidimicrobiia bacterium]NNF70539.1 hypothetical protein [Acidimicrobiia bacterium]